MSLASAQLRDEDWATAFREHEHEVRVFCYRMTASLIDAEDLTQETFLRAWRTRRTFRRDAALRTWLYRIATNACLDFLARHERRAAPTASVEEVLESDPRIDPFPDRYLASGQPAGDPAARVQSQETTDLLLVAALLHLPPRQRVAVVARDFLELTAAETAALLGASVPSVNSLVQRGHAGIKRVYPSPRAAPAVGPQESELVRRYVSAHHRGDVQTLLDMLAVDVQVSMPPESPCLGRDSVTAFFTNIVGADRPGDWWLVPVQANGRHATANYLRRPGESVFKALSLDVLDFRDGRLAGIRCFLSGRTFAAFGLSPATTGPRRHSLDVRGDPVHEPVREPGGRRRSGG